MYKLDTLPLKQKKLPVLDITGFFFRVGTRVKSEVVLYLKHVVYDRVLDSDKKDYDKRINNIYTRLFTCLTPIPRFALRDKVTLRLLKLLFLGSGCSRVI